MIWKTIVLQHGLSAIAPFSSLPFQAHGKCSSTIGMLLPANIQFRGGLFSLTPLTQLLRSLCIK